MLLLQLVLTAGLLAICSFTPGFFFVRRFRWNPLEKLCGSVGLSLLVVFLAAWLVYVTGWTERIPFVCVSAVCVGLVALEWQDIGRLFRTRAVRQAAAAFAFLFCWTLLILGTIRTYSGGLWFGDWLEHFQRSLFFLHHFPSHTVLLGDYVLPARPPMMNVLAAFFLAQTADRYEVFQLVFTFLNLLVFLPCCLLMPALGGSRRRRILALVCLFALNPVVIQNATYTWTKLFAAFYVVLAIGLYLAGWRKNDRWRMTAAFAALSAGMLVHYSAAPYLLLLVGHYLFVRKWKEVAVTAAICAALLLAWLGWSINVYGPQATFASNTTVTLSRAYQGNPVEKFAGNFFDSLVPALLRDPSVAESFHQPNSLGAFRDNVFAFYQPNLIFGMGVVGGPLILSFLYAAFERRKHCTAEGRFWLWFVPCCTVLGILAVGERDSMGDAHLTLLSLEAIGLALLAAMLPLKRTLAAALLAGCLIDFSLGIVLQARVENLENTPAETVFTGVSVVDGKYSVGDPGSHSLSVTAGRNWFRKHQYELCRRWLAELQDKPGAQQLANTLTSQLDEDRTAWNGWYANHGGSVEFLGDHAGLWPMLILLPVAAGLIKKLWDESRDHL